MEDPNPPAGQPQVEDSPTVHYVLTSATHLDHFFQIAGDVVSLGNANRLGATIEEAIELGQYWFAGGSASVANLYVWLFVGGRPMWIVKALD